MDNTGLPKDRSNQPYGLADGKWATIRDALSSWGKTVRLCLLCVALEAPALISLLQHHYPKLS